jgi:hypothetical protein
MCVCVSVFVCVLEAVAYYLQPEKALLVFLASTNPTGYEHMKGRIGQIRTETVANSFHTVK